MSESRASLDDLRIDRTAPADDGRGTRWLIALVGGVVLAGLAWWLVARPVAAQVETAAVREVVASDFSGRAVLNGSGYVTARRQATVSSKVTGKVVEVFVEEGMAVTEGQVLARLDDSLVVRELALVRARRLAAESSVRETEALLAEAVQHLTRTRNLVSDDVASEAELDSAVATVDSLTARLDRQREEIAVIDREIALSQQQLEDRTIRAPFTGVAISKDAQPGEMISPVSAGGGFTRTGICTLVDMDSLEIEVDVNESYINRVEEGQRVEATLDAWPDWSIPAHVITTVPAADRQKATVKVRIGFEELDSRILPDMGVRVAFLAAEEPEVTSTRRLMVPSGAIRQDGTDSVVFVLAGETVERRVVSIGAVAAGETEILSGLAAGERVVVQGPDDLVDGSPVTTS